LSTVSRGSRVLAASALLLAVTLLAAPASATRASRARPQAGPDLAARTPYAAVGSAAASRRALSGDRLRHRLSDLMDQTGSASGAFVYDVRTDHRVFADSARKPRILASNTKLFTTSTALDVIGANDHLDTTVWADGTLDAGVLDGDLYLIGDGDPALASKSFAASNGLPVTPFGQLSRQVKAAGVNRVTGNVYADDSIFDRVRGVPASGGDTSPYVGPLSGLSYDSGFDPGGGFANDPALVAGQALRDGLEGRGVGVGGHVKLGDAPSAATQGKPLAVVESPPISTLIAETNHVSNNFFAEMLLKRLAAVGGKVGTTERGTHLVEDFARSLGVKMHSSDGSGLTRSNTASPASVGGLLAAMLKQPYGDEFFDSLAIAGEEGTVAGRMQGTAAQGYCRAKTGTLTDVSALSGYCGKGNRVVVFSILNNSVDPYAMHPIQDQMVALIARYRP
jgi:D-alanyl-D-alanine carboxypeptidase/D-alanyl-D-alanine-endopeptidase (penicillin-binding protein 4)